MINKNMYYTPIKILFPTWVLLFSSVTHSAELPLVTLEFPPFNYTENGKIIGASTEIIHNILIQIGHTPKFISLPWKRPQRTIETGKAAGIFTYTQNPERSEAAYYSNPISTIRDVFFKRKKDDIKWHSFSDLAGKLVGASGGFNYWKGFNKAAKDKVLTTSFVFGAAPNLRNLIMLGRGRTDVFICEISVCGYLIKKHTPDFDNLDYIDKEIGPVRSFHVGFSKKWPYSKQIRDEFNKHLDEMIASRRLQLIYEKYGITTDFSKLGSKGAYLLNQTAQ